MKITEKEVMHVAKLSRLDMAGEDIEELANKMGSILEHVDTLNNVDTAGVKPASHAISINNAFREDEAIPSMNPDKILSNAPEREGTDIIVPKVI